MTQLLMTPRHQKMIHLLMHPMKRSLQVQRTVGILQRKWMTIQPMRMVLRSERLKVMMMRKRRRRKRRLK
ncbi:hypothetical protein DPMN_035015 [Dreissena polymorpha]|uniref:Uncharacterized protein n=1 Tax=Dreissena polymorpha TaxID=45954 RepID=A0A9D4RMK4_DREPO|nr:hypothetical protein DPMN_035015 [Dreissena polymorpha]